MKVCGERSWLPISKMGCNDLASSENKSKNSLFKTPFWGPFQNRRLDPKVCGERLWLPISKMA